MSYSMETNLLFPAARAGSAWPHRAQEKAG